jgi:hypothetical protein
MCWFRLAKEEERRWFGARHRNCGYLSGEDTHFAVIYRMYGFQVP